MEVYTVNFIDRYNYIYMLYVFVKDLHQKSNSRQERSVRVLGY